MPKTTKAIRTSTVDFTDIEGYVVHARNGGVVITAEKPVKVNRFNKKGWVRQSYMVTSITVFPGRDCPWAMRVEQVKVGGDSIVVGGKSEVWTPSSRQARTVRFDHIRSWG